MCSTLSLTTLAVSWLQFRRPAMLLLMMSCQPKVAKLHIVLLVQENVLWLEIPVHKATVMQVMKSIHYLREDPPLLFS